ncbi:MAG: hypothetical protein IPP08_10210 [Chlorobiota bacterium]|jgi:hypothetical protein|nr:hypothetical protein [Chlorobiota bacterium]QQS66128.1 MAG: hypothetical protein IPP08_10210 [Chlorobiota bacterium]
MEKLISLITEKTGISSEQAQGAIDSVLEFFKDKLPFGLGDQLDKVMNDDSEGGLLDKAGDMFSGLFGGDKKDDESSDDQSSDDESSDDESSDDESSDDESSDDESSDDESSDDESSDDESSDDESSDDESSDGESDSEEKVKE